VDNKFRMPSNPTTKIRDRKYPKQSFNQIQEHKIYSESTINKTHSKINPIRKSSIPLIILKIM